MFSICKWHSFISVCRRVCAMRYRYFFKVHTMVCHFDWRRIRNWYHLSYQIQWMIHIFIQLTMIIFHRRIQKRDWIHEASARNPEHWRGHKSIWKCFGEIPISSEKYVCYTSNKFSTLQLSTVVFRRQKLQRNTDNFRKSGYICYDGYIPLKYPNRIEGIYTTNSEVPSDDDDYNLL